MRLRAEQGGMGGPGLGGSALVQLFCLLAGASALVVLAVWLQWTWHRLSLDLTVYWEAGTRMREGGEGLYDPGVDPKNRVGYYIYPPTFAVLFAPLTFLPRWLGYGLWALIELLLIGASLWAVRGACGVRGRRETIAFLFATALTIYGALWQNLFEGQINTLLLLVVGLGLWALEARRPLLGGGLLAFAAHLKVLPGVLLLVLLLQGRWRAAAGMVGGMLLLALLPLVWTIPAHGVAGGLTQNARLARDYVDRLVAPKLESQKASELGGPRAPNNALSAVASRWFIEGTRLSLDEKDARGPLVAALDPALVRWMGFPAAFALYLLSLWLARRGRRDRQVRLLSAGLALTAAGLGNVLYWPHHLCLLALIAGPLAVRVVKRGGGATWFWILAAVVAGAAYLPVVEGVKWADWCQIWGMPTFAVLALWGAAFVLGRRWSARAEGAAARCDEEAGESRDTFGGAA